MITKDYKKVPDSYLENIDVQNAVLAKELNIEWRLYQTAKEASFLKLKDHKPDFPGRLSFRLLNPMKNPMGKVSKTILERINCDLRNRLGLQQWQSTSDSLRWFDEIQDKDKKKFFQFDIENFYGSISQELLLRALNWAREHTFIADKSIQIILTSRKSCLFDGQSLWVKKSNPDHDVTMGSWDGAEVAELIVLYILFRLTEVKKIFNKQDIGLFRDDGLAVIQGSGHVIDTKRKNAIKFFKKRA